MLKASNLHATSAFGHSIFSKSSVATTAKYLAMFLCGYLVCYVHIQSTLYTQVPQPCFTTNTDSLNLQEELPVIYVVTPTYTRLTQQADLIRLMNTLRLAKKIHWVVVEDRKDKSDLVKRLVGKSGLYNTSHLAISTPKPSDDMTRYQFHRGVDQRNLALKTIKEIASLNKQNANGVVYFCDDDNSYDVQLFEEMRATNKVSIWPVAFVGGQTYERPIVSESTGKVVDWHASWHKKERRFPTDMASFAFHVDLLLKNNPEPKFSHTMQFGHLESEFLSLLINDKDQLEPKADNCTNILVWHTRTSAVSTHRDPKMPVEDFIVV